MDLIEDIAAIVAHIIMAIIKFIAGLLNLDIIMVILAPILGVIAILGAIIATFTPTQELTIPLPIIDPLMGG